MLFKRSRFLFLLILLIAAPVGFGLAGTARGQEVADLNQATRLQPLNRRPVIGIATLVKDEYVRAIRKAGGVPVVLPCTDGSPEDVAAYLTLLDGLLMQGGADIPPVEYGEAPHPTAVALADDRYQFEKAMITAWIKKTEKPLLGICLGSQWINVAHGGSLVQDIPSEFGVNHRNTQHPVVMKPECRLGEIFQAQEFAVNSFHHQAVKRLGKGLKIAAVSKDGIVEGIETVDPNRFLIGVQWHPERMPESATQQRLFKAFVQACQQTAAAK